MRTLALGLLVLCLCATAVAAEPVGLLRYEVILSRKPFGEPPIEPVVSPSLQKQDSFIMAIVLCGVTQHPTYGRRVAFLDNAAKRLYSLRVGETQDGIRVVDADFAKGAALLRKGDEAFWVNLSGQATAVGVEP